MDFKKWVKNIKTVSYNGAGMVVGKVFYVFEIYHRPVQVLLAHAVSAYLLTYSVLVLEGYVEASVLHTVCFRSKIKKKNDQKKIHTSRLIFFDTIIKKKVVVKFVSCFFPLK